jgi:hypothetical protein
LIELAWVGWARAADVCASGCPYTTIQEAVDAAVPGRPETIRLEAGVHDGPIHVSGGRDVSLVGSLLGQTVILDTLSFDSVITVQDSALELRLLELQGGFGRGVDATESRVRMDAVFVTSLGSAPDDGGLVKVAGGSLETFGVTFDGGRAFRGGQLYLEDAELVANLTTFQGGSVATDSGGAVFATATSPRSAEFVTCSFVDSTAAILGGAVQLDGAVNALVTATSFTGCTGTLGGGLAVTGATADLQATLFLDCQAPARGGGLFVDGGDVTIEAGYFEGNVAGIGGGSVALVDGTLRVRVLASLDAQTPGQGGALYAEGGRLDLEDFVVDRHQATGGAGLALVGDVEVEKAHRITVCDSAAVTGAAILVDTVHPTEFHGLRLLSNIASTTGGGISHTGGGPLVVRWSNLLGNRTGGGGSAALATDGEVQLYDSVVAFNRGGIAVGRGAVPLDAERVVWFDNEQGNSSDIGTQLDTDPQFVAFDAAGSCATRQDFGRWGGPLFDRGRRTARDPDGSRADLGAWGGPFADPLAWDDTDGDGYPKLYDCDETDTGVHPEAADTPYDGEDTDCDGVDDYDADHDGFRSDVHGGPDCDDQREEVHPTAPDNLGEDLSCDGAVDFDGDGALGVRASAPGEDCEDAVAAIHPGAVDEVGRDRNCDGIVDFDRDGHLGLVAGEPGPDCDDTDPDVHPGAVERDRDVDYDCDGYRDESRPFAAARCEVTSTGPTAWLAALLAAVVRRRRQRVWSP